MQDTTGDLEAEPEEDKQEVVDDEIVHKGDGMNGEQVVNIDTRPVWEKMYDQVEDLNVRVARHFEDANDNTGWQPPMVNPPQQPTRQEWLRHQLTHTPYAKWCKHCNSARAVRQHHQNMKIRATLVPDIDGSKDGPIKISMDYMYMHERIGK